MNKEEKKAKLIGLVKRYGSAYRAAKSTGVSPSAFYERMSRLDIPRAGYQLLPNEPEDIGEKKIWLEGLLNGSTVRKVALDCGVHYNSIRARMRKCGINRANHGVEPAGFTTREQRVEWLKGLIAEHGSLLKVSKVLHVTASALYERAKRYGISSKPITKGE